MTEHIKNELAHHAEVLAVLRRQIARSGEAAELLRPGLQQTLDAMRRVRAEAIRLAEAGDVDAARACLARCYRGEG